MNPTCLPLAPYAWVLPGSFSGRVNNNANIGKSTGEIVQMWNEDHPEHVIVFAPEPAEQPA